MKLTIDGREYSMVRVGDWTFEEASIVKRLTGLRAGEVLTAALSGDPDAELAFAAVGYLRAGKDPDELRQAKLDDVLVDYTDKKQENDPSPQPEGGAGKPKPRAARSRRKT